MAALPSEIEPEGAVPDEEQEARAEMQAMIEAQKVSEQAAKHFERLQIFGASLQTKVDLQVARRSIIEERWYADLQQFHGCYPEDVLAGIKDVGGSEVFVNITRPKTETFSARLADMLLPTDDVNWGIQPTPIPEVVQGLGNQTPLVTDDGKQVVTDKDHPVTVDDMARGIKEAAKNACDRMSDEMADQLQEAQYNAVQRDVIDDMAIYGTGVLKGPTIVGNTRRIWTPVNAGKGIFKIDIVEEKKPAALRVSIWDFFPDMSATCLEDCEFIFERHLMSRRQVRALKDLPGFNKDALRRVLQSSPKQMTNSYLNRLRALSGQQTITDERYEVWEYHGPIDKQDLIAAGVDVDPEDELEEYEGIVWFCNGVVIKAVVNPLDTEERPYSVCYCAKDDTSIFGFGFPYLLRAAQAVACASWRMVLDNAGLSTGPQVVVDRRNIVPADGDHKMKPRKVWDFVGEGDIKQSFAVFGIDSHTEELLKIFETALRLGDDETNLPLIAQGNQAPHITKTAQGMSMLMNAANVVLRKAVRAYDDGITLTFIPRLYDWNMQFNQKPEIKGDFNVIAKGSSVLMEREQQTNAMIQATQVLNGRPQLAVWIDDEKFAKALMKNLRVDNVMRTKAEVDKILADEANKPQGKYKDSKEYLDKVLQQGADALRVKLEMHNSDMDVALAQMANQAQMTEQELRSKLGIKRIDVDAEIKLFNSELMARYQTGQGV